MNLIGKSAPLWRTPAARASIRGHNGSTRTLGMSAVEGPRCPELSEKTLPAFFASEILRPHASRPALTCPSERAHPHARNVGRLALDFAEFDRCIKACARGLVQMGVQPGDRVGLVMGNNSAYAILQWACASVGAILTTINPAYRTSELTSVLRLVGVKHLFVVPRIRSSHYLQMLADVLPSIRARDPGMISEEALPELRNLVVVDNEDVHRSETDALGLRSLIDWREISVWREDQLGLNTRLEDATNALRNDDVFNIQFTSGTTGLSKAVSLTHRNLLNNALTVGRCMALTERDVVCNVPPLFHCFDKSLSFASVFGNLTYISHKTRLVMGNLAAWVHGAHVVYPSLIYDPVAIVDTLKAERCTALHGVPTHFLGVLKEIQKRRAEGEVIDTQSLRTGVAAGSPIPIQLMRTLISDMNLRDLTIGYGMTETSPISFHTTIHDAFIKRVETVGKVQPHVKAKLVDEHGDVVPVNTPGELCVSGYNLQKGYWGDEEQTRKVMKIDPTSGELWMSTGDQAILDEEGYLRIVGRIKDVIIRGGENLFPVQIENALTEHPGVYEAAAIAVPDEHYGEVVGVWVIKASGHDTLSQKEVRNAVATRMNPQNSPAWVWFIDELPKTASGKVMKHVLRDRSKELAKTGEGKCDVCG